MKKLRDLVEAAAGKRKGKISERDLKRLLRAEGASPVRHRGLGGTPGYDYKRHYGNEGHTHELRYTSYSKEHSHAAIGAIADILKQHGIEHKIEDVAEPSWRDPDKKVKVIKI